MKLLIDIGNTRIKWQWRDASVSSSLEALVHRGQPQFVSLLEVAWRSANAVPDQVLVANVASTGVADELARLVRALWGLDVRVAHAEHRRGGVSNAYTAPERMGVDRWLAMLGAYRRYAGQPLCIVDAGTAITVDVLTAQGQHLGGLILPGRRLMCESLFGNTQRIPAEMLAAEQALGRDTAHCVAAGVELAAIGAVEKTLKQAALACGSQPLCCITGGDGEALASGLVKPSVVVPDLVFEGLDLWSAPQLVCP